MEQKLNPGCAVSVYIVSSIIMFGIGLLIPYFLCRIDPAIEAGWLRGLWHGSNFVGNLILMLFEERLLKAPLHTTAYSVFWWIFTVGSCIIGFLICINWITNLKKVLSSGV
ncbi:MAG: hypothetical protein LBS42_08945 [Tannerella sp.]|jgi:hypothetical protein|nr:hypothetical protein [Tannerella sp.]